MKKILFLLFTIAIILKSNLAVNAKEKEIDTYELLDLFGQIFDRVRETYVEEVTDQELIEKAIDGMLTGLDPHSGYLDAETWEEMQEETKGKFGGLGIEITMEEGFVKVVSPIEDTPAYNAGIIAGDFIVQIDDVPVLGMTINEAVELMRGNIGTSVKLTIAREGIDTFDVDITRAIIKVQSVKSDVFNNVGYIRITSFTEQTFSGVRRAINKIEDKLDNNAIGYVLDVRSNPGGLLSQAVKVTDVFLEKGEIVSTRGREKNDITRYRAKKGDLINKKPLVVIINGGSASASEIVAGALQDHKRAIIIGTKTFGKGSVQTIIPFKNPVESGIRLTTARYYTPSGISIQGKGIEPDIIIKQGKFESNNYRILSESDLKNSLDKNQEQLEDSEELSPQEERLLNDFQLARAINLIKGLSIYGESLIE
ncbi:MAG: Carboxy-terminal processing protease CtpA [Alphaproteobacteria bacterium MarineAlpha5_Bin9]|nr:MAG: Carboxy-terminal processing protease CtpA [Alphaproteobacteria bacterium MarineAlpha5_Bin9]|tara:strand:- start:2743 stop:4017 length:1275 start_codon:yes stop_codon:yes gene_type:complete